MKEKAQRPEQYCLFETGIGVCGIAWSAQGVRRLQLPEATPSATEKRLQARTGTARPQQPPAFIQQAIVELQLYLNGTRPDFTAVPLDLEGIGAFNRMVYEAARKIGWGRVASYGDIARQIDEPGTARAVGRAMGQNPIPIIIPCHRVVGSDGRAVGFSAFGGILTKENLLYLENVRIDGAPLLPGMKPMPRRR